MKNPWGNIQNPRRDVNVLRVSESHPLSMFWGKDVNGRYLFIYEISHEIDADIKKMPKLEGIMVMPVKHENKCRLVLFLNDQENWEIFYSLCLDLIKATTDLSEGEVAYSVILRRLSRWQTFLKRKRPHLLTNEEIKGLIGELLMLEEKLSLVFGWHQAISFWKGPEGAPQDFLIYDSVVEVKCQTGGSKPTINISSAEQLIPQVSIGHLAVYTITSANDRTPLAFSLNELVSRIQTKLEIESPETLERFDELICLTGYVPREEYDDPKYQKINLVCYELRDGFPRILISQIAAGIERISYSIKLEACRPFVSEPYWWEK